MTHYSFTVRKAFKHIKQEYDLLDHTFTDREAWFLFKASAYLETFGWTLLITGIMFKKLTLPGFEFVLPIGGSLHGVFVIIYTIIVFFAHRSLGWGLKRMLIAEAISSVPYAALVFELWESRRRRKLRGSSS